MNIKIYKESSRNCNPCTLLDY